MNLSIEYNEFLNGTEENIKTDRFILSCASDGNISSDCMLKISGYLAENNVNIERIETRKLGETQSLELIARYQLAMSYSSLKKQLLQISQEYKVDMAVIKEKVFRMNRRLIVFDMDSTLIQTEVIDELAIRAGVGERVKDITRRAMEGELDFKESLLQRVALLEGLSESVIEEIAENLPLTLGVGEFIKTIKKYGYKTAIVSGGFLPFAKHLKYLLGMDYAFANDLEIKNGVVTGKVKGTIIDAEQKAFLLDFLAQQEGISTEQVVAIGDGANDLLMLSKAGMGIAFHAKEVVKEKAKYSIGFGSMTNVLNFIGL